MILKCVSYISGCCFVAAVEQTDGAFKDSAWTEASGVDTRDAQT